MRQRPTSPRQPIVVSNHVVFSFMGMGLTLIALFLGVMTAWVYTTQRKIEQSWIHVQGQVLSREIFSQSARVNMSARNRTFGTRFSVRYDVAGITHISRVE